MQPRSAGTLQIGSVIYDNKAQVFSVEMLFIAANAFSPEDEIKSATLSAAQHFQKILYQNGYHDHGPPETVVRSTGPGRVLFYIACKAKKARPAIIMIHDPDKVKKKTDADSGDSEDDAEGPLLHSVDSPGNRQN